MYKECYGNSDLPENAIFGLQIAEVLQSIQITSGFHCTIYEAVELAGIIVFVFVLPVPVQMKHSPLLLKL